jgi:DNA-binding MarR family transcriptional regulator
MNTKNRILIALADGDMNQTKIANIVVCSRSLVCRLVKELVKEGLVNKATTNEDGREKICSLTEHGKMAVNLLEVDQ